ncbi:MAG: hypothetical protein HFG63_07655 [Lachnospiraceae bacterium]|nr:hypothetical protein [Lachnospiraceae bacterium]
MSNPIKDAFDKASLIKDIDERDNIILNYQRYGLLDRNDAIKKIQELRISDEDIAVATSVNLSVSSIPFSQSTNDQIVGELAMQRNILQAKLIKKQAEENNEY